MVDNTTPNKGPSPAEPYLRDRDRKRGIWPWLLLGLILLAILFFGLRGCSDGKDEDATIATNGDAAATVAPVDGGLPAIATADNGAYTAEGLRTYLGTSGADATGRAFGLDRVTFDTGSAALDASDQAVIAEAAGVLKQFPNASVTVKAYTDPAGDAAANKKLASARAVSVQKALVAGGVPQDRVLTEVIGETGTAAIEANRRVELLVKRG